MKSSSEDVSTVSEGGSGEVRFSSDLCIDFNIICCGAERSDARFLFYLNSIYLLFFGADTIAVSKVN